MKPILVTLLVSALLTSAGAAEVDLTNALANCRAIESETNRLACYDALSAPAPTEGHTSSQTSLSAETHTRQSAPPTQSTAPKFGIADRPESREQLTAEVVAVQRNRARRQIIELKNGQTWRQTDSARLRLRPGDSVEIQPGALGSYLLRKTSGGGSMRIQRIK